MTGLTLRQANGHVLGCSERSTCLLDIALSHQYLGLTGMGQGKTGIDGDSSVIGLVGTGIESQRQIRGLNIGTPSSSGRGGQGKAVAIFQHENHRLFRATTGESKGSPGRLNTKGEAAAGIPIDELFGHL